MAPGQEVQQQGEQWLLGSRGSCDQVSPHEGNPVPGGSDRRPLQGKVADKERASGRGLQESGGPE